MSRLIISEKSDAAARIATILSQGASKRTSINKVPVFQFEDDGGMTYIVGLRGHIIELDYPPSLNNWTEVKLADLISAEPEKRITAHNIVSTLRDISKDVDEVVIATDFDREGELIGLETARLLDLAGKKVSRARFSAFTKQEIDTAFRDLTAPDEKLADAAESRQKIDLAWGAVLTRFISLASKQGGGNFLSVGRVQSPTLALVVARHKAIEEFIPTPYWNVSARFQHGPEFHGNHVKNPFHDEAEAAKALANCEGQTNGKVLEYEKHEKDEYPLPPFNTTMMLMEANKLGFTASRAMKIAEDLYTAGYISYPRTDNTVYPTSLGLRRILEKLKESDFKAEAEELLAQEHVRPSRGKVQTTDHPPIYPTEAATSKQLKGEKWAIYELVARRFMATVAPPAKAELSSASIDVNTEVFDAKGYKMLFLGWKKYYPYFKINETDLPELSIGQEVDLLGVTSDKRMTQPPSRYSQGSLIQEMERLGLGTKSTRHDIIQKLYDRKYVEGNDLMPTPSGVAVAEALIRHAQIVADPKMTAHLEQDMDEIASGKTSLNDVVSESQDMLSDILDTMETHREQIGGEIQKALESQHFIGKCPKCGSDLKAIRTRFGKSFVGCSKYPECDQTYPMPPGALVQPTEEICQECKAPMVKVIRRGQPVSVHCLDPNCPTNKERTTIATCPKCGKDLRLIYSRAGKRFLGCSGYPDCDQTYPLPQMGQLTGTGEKCSACGAPVLMIRNRGRTWTFCANMECPTKKGKDSASAKKPAAKKTAAKKAPAKKASAKKAAPKKATAKKPTAKKAEPPAPAE
ncbi:DNA topoisomerase I [Methanomassiliicoccus luminyensis]|uniref:DNA topoisomerase I n=1 Tax=Methanomassiliicoccus luminyensis TaxID=1080712 RepID=UPI00036DF512|nr:DNA topoisomerase I [Methanomassiliicoccus luminyensis]